MPRLFFGIKPPATVIRAIRDAYEQPLAMHQEKLMITPPENWHITTHFIGNVTRLAAKKIIKDFAHAQMPSGGSIRVGGETPLGIFGEKVLFLRLIDEDDVLSRAHAHGKKWVPVIERKEFRPHLTLARNEKIFRLKKSSGIFHAAPSLLHSRPATLSFSNPVPWEGKPHTFLSHADDFRGKISPDKETIKKASGFPFA